MSASARSRCRDRPRPGPTPSTNPSGVGTARTSFEMYFGPGMSVRPAASAGPGGGQREVEAGVPTQELVAALDRLLQEVAAVESRLRDVRAHALGPRLVGQGRDPLDHRFEPSIRLERDPRAEERRARRIVGVAPPRPRGTTGSRA